MKSLFDPIQLKHLSAKNRLVRSATWEGIANLDGSLPEEAYAIYDELAGAAWGPSSQASPAWPPMTLTSKE